MIPTKLMDIVIVSYAKDDYCKGLTENCIKSILASEPDAEKLFGIEKIFNINLNNQSILEFYNIIYKKLLKKYQFIGVCYQNMVEQKINASCCIIC